MKQGNELHEKRETLSWLSLLLKLLLAPGLNVLCIIRKHALFRMVHRHFATVMEKSRVEILTEYFSNVLNQLGTPSSYVFSHPDLYGCFPLRPIRLDSYCFQLILSITLITL